MEDPSIKKYFFWATLLILSVLAYFMIKNYLVAILSAFVFAYLLLPIHKFLSKKISKKIAALIIIIAIVLILVLAGYLIINTLINQGSEYLTNENLQKLTERTQNFAAQLGIQNSIADYIPQTIEKLSAVLLIILSSIPGIGFSLFLTLFISYFILVDWENISKEIKKIIPFKQKEKIIKNLSQTSNNIIHGYLLIAIIEFIIASIGFWIAGIPFFAFFAFLIAIFAFIPLLGPFIIWVPILIIKFIQGDYSSAIIILITGGIISGLIDTILVNVIVGKKAKIHPAILLLGVIGGVSLFGIFGFIIGPLLLSFLVHFIQANANSD